MLAARHLPDLIALGLAILIQSVAVWWILRGRPSGPLRSTLLAAWLVSICVLSFAYPLRFAPVARYFPDWAAGWGRGAAFLWAFLSVLLIFSYGLGRLIARPRASHSPARWGFLGAVRLVLLGAPAAAAGYGTFIQRFRFTVREQNIEIPGLPADLDGLRLAQVTDIHMGPFLGVRELEHVVSLANETRPHLTLVTGDLITSAGDPLDDCLNTLSRLKADAGVFGCMGNHEIYAKSEEYTQFQGALLGMRFLRQQSALLRFGSASLNLAGVDYQIFKKPYLVGAEKLIEPAAFNILLSHNPDVFPIAAAKGFPLTLAGHTHGGQVRCEILHQDLNVARFFTPYVDGLYRVGGLDRIKGLEQKAGSAIFVSRGIGTIALPARLGAPPEVALIKLCRS
jgi:predicted MPP superfamily phosphohydrolase